MGKALEEAHAAFDEGEVPVGAVVVQQGRIIGKGHNRMEGANDATAHAEILAIGAAGLHLKNWRLDDCEIFITLEPCPMCAGAILNSRVERLIFGCPDNRFGACGSAYNLFQEKTLGREVKVVPGIMAEECLHLLQGFFQMLRRSGK
jgi:tRNA(adenine34) deaminase